MDGDVNTTVAWFTRKAYGFPNSKIPLNKIRGLAAELEGECGVSRGLLMQRAVEAKLVGGGEAVGTEHPTVSVHKPARLPLSLLPPASGLNLTPKPELLVSMSQQSLPNLASVLPKSGFKQKEHPKGSILYIPDSKDDRNLYLVLSGRFLSFSLENNRKVGLEVLQVDDVFGFDCIWGRHITMVTCLDKGITLSWPASQLEDLMKSNAEIGIAFLRELNKRTSGLYKRIDQFAGMCIGQRLVAFLINLGESQQGGAEVSQGDSIKLEPYTHELLSDFIGTSREIITHYMNVFREAGYLRYNRRAVYIYNPSELFVFAGKQSSDRDPEQER